MVPQLYLIAPADAEADGFAAALQVVLAGAEIAALLLPRGVRDASAYAAFVAAIAPLAQAAGCAVLIEGDAPLAKRLGVDGVHVEASTAAVKTAIAALRPGLIIGVGGVATRDDAMTLGEFGPDYIMFGPLSGAIAVETRELAGWWAETMEVPGVLSDPQADVAGADAAGCEFLALSDSLWAASDPAAAVVAIARRLEQAA